MNQPASPEDRMLAFVDKNFPEEKPAPAPKQQEQEDKPDRFGDEEEPRRAPRNDAEAADEAEAATEETEQTEEETAEERILRLKHDGQEIEKPESEVIALAQQGFDYTQKTQKLAEDRKVVESQSQALKAQEMAFRQQVDIQNTLIVDIAKATSIDQQLSQYQNLDWQALSNTDPVEAQKLFFAYNQLQVQRGQVVAEVQKKHQELTYVQQQAKAKQVELGQAVLVQDIPGWGKELGETLKAAGKEYGATDLELNNLTEPWVIKALYDANQWKKFQAEKPVADKKVAAASPTVKPGAKNTKNAASARDKLNREQLRKTGKSEFAVKSIERLL